MTIITQDNELVNYDAVKLISTYAAEINIDDNIDEIEIITSGEEKTRDIYVLLAFDSHTEIPPDGTDEMIGNGSIQLGVFSTADACESVIRLLAEEIAAGKNIFTIPQDEDVRDL